MHLEPPCNAAIFLTQTVKVVACKNENNQVNINYFILTTSYTYYFILTAPGGPRARPLRRVRRAARLARNRRRLLGHVPRHPRGLRLGVCRGCGWASAGLRLGLGWASAGQAGPRLGLCWVGRAGSIFEKI